jgi:hypothetical protein
MACVPPSLKRAGCALVACLAVLAVGVPAAQASLVSVKDAPGGAKRMTYRIGPFKVIPGQNEIGNRIIADKPRVDGWITRIKPDLTYTNGKVPGVDVIHLHHGVWLNLGEEDLTWPGLPERFVAAGEEKTIADFPDGYGYLHRTKDSWLLNHMIHNLTPVPTQVYMTYEIDFIPRTSPRARGIKRLRPVWMDVQNGSGYPVFDVRKGAGRKGRYTYPNQARNPYAGGPRKNEWVADRGGVLVATAGHLHPGGLHTDLWVRRNGARLTGAARGRGRKAHLFRSKARYWEPAGAVSWDVSMTATRPDWRVRIRKGDVLSTTATYDTRRAAWWESMGIMVAFMAEPGPGRNPFRQRVNHPGRPTHGHLPENNNHGGERTGMPNAVAMPDGRAASGVVEVLDFKYTLGDLSLPGEAGRPAVVPRGQSITFRNADDGRAIYHSITSCKPPCNRATGIAYPIADGPVQFESGTLGSAVPPATGQLEWKTPPNLDRGTYTYFCRIHPFMRGAFRVK